MGVDPEDVRGSGGKLRTACGTHSEAGVGAPRRGRDPSGPRSAPAATRGSGSLRGRGRPRGLGRPEVRPARPDPPRPPAARPCPRLTASAAAAAARASSGHRHRRRPLSSPRAPLPPPAPTTAAAAAAAVALRHRAVRHRPWSRPGGTAARRH